MRHPGRLVKLVLVTPNGELVGTLAAFPVASPWWQQVEEVVRGAMEHYGVHVTVLRLLNTNKTSSPGGAVTYLAEVEAGLPASHWNGRLEEHPLRMPWARPGGPAADLGWTDDTLTRLGMTRIGPAEQVRTWNLSSIWRIPVEGRTVWLKVVPPFFVHEGTVLEKLQRKSVPRLLAQNRGRMLLHEIPGQDLYNAPMRTLLRMVSELVKIQRDWMNRTNEMLRMGLPDWRRDPFKAALAHTVEANEKSLSVRDRKDLSDFLDGLDSRFDAVKSCGIPDTIVHGDFHPGNCRGDSSSFVILDWGDCCVGHPLLDEPPFLDRVQEKQRHVVREHWHREWRDAIPGSDPARASQFLAPIATARLAAIYKSFLENIEPSERPYHQSDPAIWLRRTATLVRDERFPGASIASR